MKFSVIIPFYNRQAHVDAVLQSVESQSERDFEVIAVDDGSTDGTWEVLQSHPTRPNCLRLENGGAAIARNEGAALAKGDYLAFLDSDDLWFSNSLSLYGKAIDDYEAPAIVTGNPAIFSGEELPQQEAVREIQCESFENYLEAYDSWRWFGVSSFVIKRRDFNEAGGFTALRINAEDADLMLKLGCAKGFVHIKKPATFGYRRHADNLTNDLSMNLSGLTHIVSTEHKTGYPGSGKSLRDKRRIIISRHLRPAVIALIKAGKTADAWPLYRDSLIWHLRQMRFRFIAYCGVKFLANLVRKS